MHFHDLLKDKDIEEKILANWVEYTELFMLFQSEFFLGLYKRYQSIENGNIVLYFAMQTHQDILRQKDYNLNFNISFDKFWINHKLKIDSKKKSIIKIAKDLTLPKETTRRKIIELMKQKILVKKDKSIMWFPSKEYKANYNIFVQKEIEGISKLIYFICSKTKVNITKTEIVKEINEKFSFYWFNYLNAQLEYLKIWNNQFKDLELAFIFMQVVSLFASKANKQEISHDTIYGSPSAIKNFQSASISATSISEITNIPRATCVRKLSSLVSLKIIKQNKVSKRYYLSSESISSDVINKQTTRHIIKNFSEFYFITIRALQLKLNANKD